MSARAETRRVALVSLFGAFVALALVSLVLFSLSSFIEGVGLRAITHPLDWLAGLDHETASEMLFNVADIVAGLLSIAITVSAIVVELAANRYNHRITWLFVREPVNVAVMSLFTVTTIQCVWIAITREAPGAGDLPNAAFAITLALATICLVVLLPYFAFVFAFLSPLSIIEKIKERAYAHIEGVGRASIQGAQLSVQQAIDELQDVARSASEQSDRGIAMACVNALRDIVVDYQALREDLPASWYSADGPVAEDPDFVSLAQSALDEIQAERIWLEVKVFRQYLSLMTHSVPDARDVANLIAINTGRIGIQEGAAHPELLALCIRCFNSYLRTSINAADARTSYYVMNQYWLLAQSLMRRGMRAPVIEIAGHFKFYGQLAHQRGQSFLLEVAAHDLTRLVEESVELAPNLTDELLGLVLELDQEIRSETAEESLLGVRRAQLQLATLFSLRGDDSRARRICRDLAGERLVRLDRLRKGLELETRPHYWEFTDRGVNFGYLAPDRRSQLPQVFQWIREAVSSPA